jgi:hypothetical protein
MTHAQVEVNMQVGRRVLKLYSNGVVKTKQCVVLHPTLHVLHAPPAQWPQNWVLL